MGSFSPPPPSPPARTRRRAPSFSVSESGSVKSESKQRARDKQDGVVERFMRSELSHGDYSFKKVWAHFRDEGWSSRNGHELSYDHYYVKPGKSVKTGVQGEDFFLGERELVSYGLRMRIFGEPVDEPLGVASPSHVQEVLLSQQQSAGSADNEQDRGRKASRKRQRRPDRDRSSSVASAASSRSSARGATSKSKKRRGSRMDDPISLLSGSSSNGSDSSGSDADRSVDRGHRRSRRRRLSVSSSSTSGDESWTGNDERGGFHDPADDDDDEADEEEDSSVFGDDDSSENQEDENEYEEDEEELDDEVEGGHASAFVAGGKFHAKDSSYRERKREQHQEKPSRPLLSTSKSKKKRVARHHEHGDSRRHEVSADHTRKQGSVKSSADKRPPKHSKRSPSVSAESCFDDDDFSLGAEEYGASPPRRPPTSSRDPNAQRRRSVPSTPTGDSSTRSAKHSDTSRRSASVPSSHSRPARHSFLSPSPQDNSFEGDEMESGDHFDSADTPPTAGDYEPSSSPVRTPLTPSPTTSTATSSSWTEEPATEVSKSSDLSATLLELRDVVFPQDSSRHKYHVLVATQRNGATCIVLENTRSHDRLECTFRDVKELPGNAQQVIPGTAVIEALLRCLRALPGIVVVNSGTFSDSKEDTGKIELIGSSSDAEAFSQDVRAPAASRHAVPVTLRFAFPCFDFWRCDHNFPMKRVPSSHAQVVSLVAELKEVKVRLADADEQLKATLRDRDELKTRVEAVERERDSLQQALAEKEKAGQLALQQLGSASQLQVVELKIQATKLEGQVSQLRAELAQHSSARTDAATLGGEGSDTTHNSSASPASKDRQAESKGEDPLAPTVIVVVQSPWLAAFMPRVAEAIRLTQQSAMHWDAIVSIDKEFYHADADDTGGRVTAITVLKTGTYQVNAHTTHERNMRMALQVESSPDSDDDSQGAAATTALVESTLVQMYDNKRRISRVDRVLSLHTNDRVAVVLLPTHVADTSSGSTSGPVDANGSVRETWPPVFKPQSNQLALTFLDPQCLYDSASTATTR